MQMAPGKLQHFDFIQRSIIRWGSRLYSVERSNKFPYERIQIKCNCYRIHVAYNENFIPATEIISTGNFLTPNIKQGLLTQHVHLYIWLLLSVIFCSNCTCSFSSQSVYSRWSVRVQFSWFLGVGWDWVHSVRRPLICLLYQPHVIDGDECGAVGRMRIGRGNWSTWRNPAPVSLCPPQIPHDLTWAWTQAAAVGSWRLTAWAMAWPKGTIYPLGPSLFQQRRRIIFTDLINFWYIQVALYALGLQSSRLVPMFSRCRRSDSHLLSWK
jgi:hypothetical protein